MTDIKTLRDPGHQSKVEVSLKAEFSTIESFKKDDLEVWLARLPSGSRVKFEGVRSGKIILVARWTERRGTVGPT